MVMTMVKTEIDHQTEAGVVNAYGIARAWNKDNEPQPDYRAIIDLMPSDMIDKLAEECRENLPEHEIETTRAASFALQVAFDNYDPDDKYASGEWEK